MIFVLQQVSPVGQVACFDFSHDDGKALKTVNCVVSKEANFGVLSMGGGVSKHWFDLTHVCPSNSVHSHFFSKLLAHFDVSSKSSPRGVLPEIFRFANSGAQKVNFLVLSLNYSTTTYTFYTSK